MKSLLDIIAYLFVRALVGLLRFLPEKLAFDEIRAEHGMRVFLEARDAPFRDV